MRGIRNRQRLAVALSVAVLALVASACGSRLTGNQAALAQGAFGHSGNSGSGTGTGTGAQALGTGSSTRLRRRARRRLVDDHATTTTAGQGEVRRRPRPSTSSTTTTTTAPCSSTGPALASGADRRRRVHRVPPRRGRHRRRRGDRRPRPPWPACRGLGGLRGQRQPGAGRRQRRRHGHRRHRHDHHRRQHRQHQRRRAGAHPERAAGHRGLGRLREQHRRHLRPPDQGAALRRRQRLGHQLRRRRSRPARATSPWSATRRASTTAAPQAVGSCGIPDMAAEVSTAAAGGTADIFGASPGQRPLLAARPGQLPQGDLPQRHPARGDDLPAGAGHPERRRPTRWPPNTSVGFDYTPAGGIPTTPTNANYGSIVQELQSNGAQYVTEYSDDNSAERLLQAMQQANFAPQVVDWFSEEYSPQFAQQTSPESNGDLVAHVGDRRATRRPAATRACSSWRAG